MTAVVFNINIRVASSENVLSSMRKICVFTSSCIIAKYNPGLCSPLKHSIVPSNSVCGQRRPCSDCVDAQADLGLRCPHMPEDTFSYGSFHIIVFAVLHVSSSNI